MRSCPQCKHYFEDDFAFCLNDGTMLEDESGEIETRIGQRVQMPMSAGTGAEAPCPSCGMSNRVHSKFCKKCGVTLAAAVSPPLIGLGAFSPQIPADAPDWRPNIFTPPAAVSGANQRPDRNNTNILLGAILTTLVVIGGIVIYSFWAPETTGDAKGNRAIANAVNTSASNGSNAVNKAPNTASADPRIGKVGTLTTDANIRAEPDSNYGKLGTQYRGARVRILDVASGVNKDGGTSIFFKIEVMSYGVSLEPSNYGLGKDPGTPDVGWVNAYPMINGYRQDLLTLD